MTNYERIKAMSVEEMAEDFLAIATIVHIWVRGVTNMKTCVAKKALSYGLIRR